MTTETLRRKGNKMADQISLVVFDPCEAMVSDLVKKNEIQQFDHTTEDGEKALRSWVHRIRGGKGEIEKVRKSMKADALAFGRKVDDRAKELTAPLDRMITDNMKPLDEIEAEKRRRAEAIVEAERIAAEKAEQARVSFIQNPLPGTKAFGRSFHLSCHLPENYGVGPTTSSQREE